MSEAPHSLPLVILPVSTQRYSCHGCGNCCRDFTVELRRDDWERLQSQRWSERMDGPVTVEFRGKRYLRQREDGACVFLMSDGKCRIHAEFGLEAKPLACQLFPFVFAPDQYRAHVALSFACQSVLANKGAELPTHMREVARMARRVPELRPTQPKLDDAWPAEGSEVSAMAELLDQWVRRTDLPIAIRLDGLAWLAQQLAAAHFRTVRGERFRGLLEVLVGALANELPLHPFQPATAAQRASVRQAAFFRLEDPKIGSLQQRGRVRTVVTQFMNSRAFARGRGPVPPVGGQWPRGATFEGIEGVKSPLASPDLVIAGGGGIDDLFTRWLRATILGGRAWGSGYYGWPMTRGLQALALNAACALWLARAHAAAKGRDMPTLEDAQAAVGRVDRACGRAPWLGSRAESLRVRYLRSDDGLRRIMQLGME